MKNTTRKCSIEGCGTKHYARGYCNTHYLQYRDMPKCTVEDCNNKQYAKGYCKNHHSLSTRNGLPIYKRDFVLECSVEGCEEKAAHTTGLCRFHSERRKNGIKLDRPKGIAGSLNPRWNGGVSDYPNHYKLKKNRLIALERDNYICQYCGGEATQAHHKDMHIAVNVMQTYATQQKHQNLSECTVIH
jgi:5-methylcytosine-specific restriction endonuclease McrA